MNRSFAFFASSLSLWTAALAFGRLYPAYYVPALQLAFAAGSLSAMGVVMFVDALPVPYISETRRSLWVFGAGAGVLSVLSFSPWVVAGVRLETHGMQALYGPLHPLFALYLLACFAYVSRVLRAKHRAATGLTKIQIRYVFFAFVVPGLLVTTSNAIVPFLLKTSAYSRYGPAFSLLMLGCDCSCHHSPSSYGYADRDSAGSCLPSGICRCWRHTSTSSDCLTCGLP